jgi:hypothetical protein
VNKNSAIYHSICTVAIMIILNSCSPLIIFCYVKTPKVNPLIFVTFGGRFTMHNVETEFKSSGDTYVPFQKVFSKNWCL